MTMTTYYFYNDDFQNENGFDDVYSHSDTVVVVNPTDEQLKELMSDFDYYDVDCS